MNGLSSRDTLLLVALTVAWGINWPIMKLGVMDYPPLTFRTSSMMGGLAILIVVIRSRGLSFKVPRQDWPELFWIGVTNMVVWYSLSIYAVKLLASGRAAILGYTLPIWTALFGIFLFREKLNPRLIGALFLASGAVFMLLKDELSQMSGRPLGMLLMLTSAALWGLGTHLMRRRKTTISIFVLMFWCLCLTALVTGTIVLTIELPHITRWPNQREWFAIIYNAIVVFGFCQIAWFRLATVLPPTASALSVMLIPVLGVFSSMVVLGEQPKFADYGALSLIVCAILLTLFPSHKKLAD
jgi:drug/metabolite transporter (DMT)-like permease